MSGAAGFLKKTQTSSMEAFAPVNVNAIGDAVAQETSEVGNEAVAAETSGVPQETSGVSDNVTVLKPPVIVEQKAEPVVEFNAFTEPKEVVGKTDEYLSSGIVASSEKASAVSDFRVTSLLDSLGIKAEGNKDIRIIKLVESNNVSPLPGVDVRDTSGRISQVLSELQKFCDITIVPAQITNIPRWVSPKEHGIFVFGGRQYFYPFNPSDSKERIDSFIESVMKELKDGKIIKRSMFKSFEYEKNEYKTLMFTQTEMSDIVTLLSNFGANIFVIGDDDILLVAGDYIYG